MCNFLGRDKRYGEEGDEEATEKPKEITMALMKMVLMGNV